MPYLILPLHRDLDGWREDVPGTIQDRHHATRHRGPPTRTRSVGAAIRVGDLGEPDELKHKVDTLLAHHNALRQGLGKPTVNFGESSCRTCSSSRPRSCHFAEDVWERLDNLRAAGKRILFRGRAGPPCSISTTAPTRSSPHPTPVAAQAMIGSGLGNGAVGYVLGIAKAYTTRVGKRPLPDRAFGRGPASCSATRGNEFGTNTGRPRRCGWFDAVDGAPGGQS